MPGNDSPGFFKSINDAEAGQLLAFAANCSGVGGALISIGTAIFSALSQSDTDRLLGAIDALSNQLQVDFVQLGNLIKQQTQLILSEINATAIATALAHTGTSLDKLARYLRTHDVTQLELADTESDLGVQFFLRLPQNPPDTAFLPGLLQAGTARVAVIAAEDPRPRSIPEDVATINQMVSLLNAMVQIIKQRVDAAHVIIERTHIIHTHPIPTGVIDGFAHEENGGELEFFSVNVGLTRDPTALAAARVEAVERAQRDAIIARQAGVVEELAFIGVPAFEAVGRTWRDILRSPIFASPGISSV